MGKLRPDDRKREPLHVFVMATALAVAAVAGAVLGFVLDAFAVDEDAAQQLQDSENAEE